MNSVKVERWDTCEFVFETSESYGNPFTEVELTARFVHEKSGAEIVPDGFFDGDGKWKIRFMPPELGLWRFKTQSGDSALDGNEGSLYCVPPEKPYLHGPLKGEGLHFRHVDGTRRYLISTRVSCHFASPEILQRVIDFCRDHRIYRIFFIMGGVYGIIRELYGGDSGGGDSGDLDFSRYNIEKFQAIDRFIDMMRQADVLATPYFYYANDGDQSKMSPEEDKAYIRYGMARFGAYSNVMPCLANQVELKYSKSGDSISTYDPRNYEWANTLGEFMKEKAVFGVPVTVHNPMESYSAVKPSYHTILQDWQFPWADFMVRQIQVGALGGVNELSDDTPEQGVPGSAKGADGAVFPRFYSPRSFANLSKVVIGLRRFGIPVIDEEPGYEKKGTPGSYSGIMPKTWNFQNSESLLNTFWVEITAGVYFMWGHLETYCLDDPLPGMQNSVVPGYVKIMHDFMTRLAYWEMEPDNDAVSPFEVEIEGKPWRTNFCCSKPGELYLVFSEYGGQGEVTLAKGGPYEVTRLNPRTGDETSLGTTQGGKQAFTLPLGEWVLLYKKSS